MFYPGAKILSVGSYGCNMSCPWCQNDSISRGRVDADTLSPDELVEMAKRSKDRGNIGIAYTYNEPSVGFEFVMDTAILAKKHGLMNVVVSNGMLERDRFEELLPYIDAYNIDLKTGDERKYASIGGDLALIMDNIRSASKSSHIELTTLVVPRFNDDEEDMRHIVSLTASMGKDVPLHITRFFPAGNMRDASPTDLSVLYRFRDIASSELNNVFLGNV